MGDTSERSKPPTLPPRCPCGFWGSSKTMNLCSKCFADVQKKQPVEDCTPKPIQSTGSSQSPVFSSETSSSSSQSRSLSPPPSSEQLSAEEPSPAFSSTREGRCRTWLTQECSTETKEHNVCRPQKRPKARSARPQNVHENQPQAQRARPRQRNDHGQKRRKGAARRPAGRPSRRTVGAAIAAKPN
ncbi:AN1-type zinc finger protein 3-like isoform X2 [Archocentrus centrarchus]|uniref:AN1-type zinc finger protein 3-like isoform X2 n=1 Tax=Archocentrus centrarchus TaxID=63155 RepID=UPI0011EA1BE7|nr:AN1-type zinc finger protein 3-like isoform X2 [Archocentrus centrarchus]